MSVLEKEIEAKVVTWAKKHGFLAPKVKFAEAGYPDRLFLSPKGHTIFIEFKVPGERPDPLQQYRIRTLRERGIPAFWTDSFVESVNILKAALEPSQLPGESNSPDVDSGGGGTVLRPRFGENVDSPGSDQDSPDQTTDYPSVDSGPSPSGRTHLAERDEQVGGVRQPDVCSDSRSEEAGEAET